MLIVNSNLLSLLNLNKFEMCIVSYNKIQKTFAGKCIHIKKNRLLCSTNISKDEILRKHFRHFRENHLDFPLH